MNLVESKEIDNLSFTCYIYCRVMGMGNDDKPVTLKIGSSFLFSSR